MYFVITFGEMKKEKIAFYNACECLSHFSVQMIGT